MTDDHQTRRDWPEAFAADPPDDLDQEDIEWLEPELVQDQTET